MSSGVSGIALLHGDQVTDAVDHPAQLRGVRPLDGLADPAQAQRAQGVALRGVGAVGRLDLGDDEAGHQDVSPSPVPDSVGAESGSCASAPSRASASSAGCSESSSPPVTAPTAASTAPATAPVMPPATSSTTSGTASLTTS